MKKTIIVMLLSLGVVAAFGQKSPKAETSGEIAGVNVKIVYHSPSARGRTVMGDLVPYGKVWRTGANNATTLEISGDVKVEGKELKAGRYGLFTVPGKDKWTIVLNSNADQWGAFNYSSDDDVLRVDVEPGKTDDFVEAFVISVEKDGVKMKWENTSVFFNVSK